MKHAHDEHLLDLLSKHATEGLTMEEQQQLGDRLQDFPEIDEEWLTPAAAAIDRAIFELQTHPDDHQMLPNSIRQQIENTAVQMLPEINSSEEETSNVRSISDSKKSPKSSFNFFSASGWLAAAAVLIWALFLRGGSAPETLTPTEIAQPTVAEAREDLIANSNDLIQTTWATPEDPEYANVRGDVVWSNEKQTGYMRLSGLPVNDPNSEQYQLWIVDPSRDTAPIDGGVFDINSSGEVIVPIDAKLKVNQPAAFAITVEQPGGVVVSEGPLRVVAAVENSQA